MVTVLFSFFMGKLIFSFLALKPLLFWLNATCFVIYLLLTSTVPRDLYVELLTDPRNTSNPHVLIIHVLAHALATFANVSTML